MKTTTSTNAGTGSCLLSRSSSALYALCCLALMTGLWTLAGCSQDAGTEPEAASSAAEQTNSTPLRTQEGAKFILTSEPEEARDVIQVRENAGDGDDVVIVGRIGGSENPWIDGRAAFSIVDGSLQACSDIPGDSCEKPWDYCCETSKLPEATALVKFVDENGELVKTDAKQLLDVRELSTVVVRGKASRDDSGNLTVLASGVYIRNR